MEIKLVVEINLDPGAIVVLDFPLVPLLVTVVEQVLGLTLFTMTMWAMFSCYCAPIV